MKNKGFTLTELIAVIIVLGLIGLLATGSISAILKRSKERARLAVIKEVEQAATKHVAENITDFNNPELEYILTMEELLKTPHLKGDEVIDPKTNEKINVAFKEQKDC